MEKGTANATKRKHTQTDLYDYQRENADKQTKQISQSRDRGAR